MAGGNNEAWCADKLAKLLNEDLRISTLNEIKEHFSELSQDEASETANCLPLPMVFDCLNDSRTEQIDLACEVLSLCMTNLSLGTSTNRYATSLERALYHPSVNVKIMALKELYRTASNRETISELVKQIPFIVALVVNVGDEELSVAKLASDTLVLIGKTSEGLRQLLSKEIKQVFSQTIVISDIVRFRVYELIIEIALESGSSLQSLTTSGLLFSLIKEVDQNDILLKLNALELLSKLAQTNHGLEYLEKLSVIDKLTHDLSICNEDPLSLLILPGLLKFFGNIAFWKPRQTYLEHPDAFSVLLDIIIAGDFSILGVAYDTLGHIGSTSIGKITLQNLEEKLIVTLSKIGEQLNTIPSEFKPRALNCIENLIRIPVGEQNNRVHSITRTWFTALCCDPLTVMMKYARNPFIDVRCAGLSIIQAIAEQSWGQELINNRPDLIEFFVDRRIESSKESKELKYDIVVALSTATGVFSETTITKLQEYVKQGPFFVQPITDVAIEGEA